MEWAHLISQTGLYFDPSGMFEDILVFFLVRAIFLGWATVGLVWLGDLLLIRRQYSLREIFMLVAFWALTSAWGAFLFV